MKRTDIEEDQVNGQISPPQKRIKPDVQSCISTGNAANLCPSFVPNHLRHKIDAHKGQCSSVVFLNNSQYLISGGKDSAIKFWDTNKGTITSSLEGFQGSVCDLAISSDNSLLVAGLTSRSICIWDINFGQVLRNFSGQRQKVCAVDISKVTGQHIVSSAADDSAVLIWDLHHDYPIHGFHFTFSNCNALRFAANDSIICSGHDDGKIRFHNTERYWSIGVIKVHTQPITSICSLQNGNVMLTSGRDTDMH